MINLFSKETLVITKYSDLDKLKNIKKTLRVDLSQLDYTTRKSVIDFVCGFIYNNGTIHKINKDVFELRLKEMA